MKIFMFINPTNKFIIPKIKMSPQLSLDIEAEIIKRLPVKYLIQFRSVCKAWKSMIDSSQFIAGYSFSHTQSHHLMIRYTVGKGKEMEVKYVSYVDDDDTFPQQKFALTVPPLAQATELIGSSHGLLCLIGYFEEQDNFYGTKTIVLWNPAIRKSIAVVVPPNVEYWSYNSVVGFGVCPETKDPKLVMSRYIDEPHKMETINPIPCQVMVFTLSSGQWKTPRSNLPRRSIELTDSHTVIGRFIYWFAYDWIVFDDEFHNLIMSFDMSTEEFREVDLPDSLAYMYEIDMSFSRLRESLVLLEYDIDFTTDEQVCNVWMMDHGDSKVFTKIFTINPPNASVSWTLGFRNSGEAIVQMRGDGGKPGALIVYDPRSEQITDLGIRRNIFPVFGSSYTESLLLLNRDDGQIIK